MSDARNDQTPQWIAPYIPWARIPKLIEQLETDCPPRIDRTVLTGSNQVRYQTLKALTSLGLIDAQGLLSDTFRQLIDAKDDRVVLVRRIIAQSYPEAVELGANNGTQLQLEEIFRKYGVSGSTSRKAIAFFLKAAEYAEIPMSPHFRTPPVSRRPPKRKATRTNKDTDAANADGPDAEDADTMSSLRVRYVEMLMKKTDSAEQLDEKLLDRIERLLHFGSTEEERMG